MKKTLFNRAHYTLGGKMVDFAGWDLPVQYSGLNEEHQAVRTTGGIFDVSHMGEIYFRGPQALAAVQHLTSNDASKLEPGKIQYSGLLTERGTFVDDLLVYMITPEEYLLVVNAANLAKDYQWMLDHTGNFDVTVTNESDEYSQVAIQGPRSAELLAHFTDIPLGEMPYYTWKKGVVAGIPALVSRTGYTGEYGFEVYFKGTEEQAVDFYLNLASKGKDYGIIPCGLGARDTLRLEAAMALYGNDIDDAHTVLEAGLGWILKLKKGPFMGREVLEQQKQNGITRKLVGFEMAERGIARHGYPVYWQGQQVGEVTSGTHAPFLKKAIGMTYLPLEAARTGERFEVEIRGKKVSAQVVELPFYKRS